MACHELAHMLSLGTQVSQRRHELRNTGNAKHRSNLLSERSSQTTEQHIISFAGGVSALRPR